MTSAAACAANACTLRRTRMPDAARFWKNVAIGAESECWPWLNANYGIRGYGHLRDGETDLKAHRIAFTLSKGEVPLGMCVLHHCDNPPCCNPSHLFLGTYADNAKDRKCKGRNGDHKGSANGRAKLTEADVLYIRECFIAGGVSYSAMARQFGVSRVMVKSIVMGRNWAHLLRKAG